MAFPDDPAQPQRPARHFDTGLEPGRSATEPPGQVVQAIFAVGLRLQNTAMITVDPLVRRQIERACSDLEDVIRVIRDAALASATVSQDAGCGRASCICANMPRPWTSPSTDR